MNINKILSRDEVRSLMKRNNWLAAYEVAFTWAVIIATFAVVAVWPNVFTIIGALIILGGRQLALAILMHDTSHHALFKTKAQNNFVGQWLCGHPIFHDMQAYRPYHLEHHQHTGTERDPDLKLSNSYPVTKPSFARKVARDLSGLSGIKAHYGIVMMHLGYLKYSLGGLVIRINEQGRKFFEVLRYGGKNLFGPVITNLLMLLIFSLIGMPWLYLLWIGSMLTTGMFFARIRSIAEHAVTPDTEDPLNNTRTTYAAWYERLLFAPHHVHYHLEHHLMPSVPSYNLHKLHTLLKERGVLDNACVETSYGHVFRKAMSA